MAYFFQANRQRYTQWNPHRRGTRGVIPQCVLHTFEWPPERTMLSAAAFLLIRTTPGSYHTIAGPASERDVLRLAPVTAETWHCVPSNNWAIGISATTYASRWGSLGSRTRRNFIHSMAYAAYLASLELIAAGKSPIPAKSISRAEAMAGVWGFTYHRTMDPGRRTDPANPASTFPWAEFLAEYRRLMGSRLGATITQEDWFDMASEQDLRKIVSEHVEKLHAALKVDVITATNSVPLGVLGYIGKGETRDVYSYIRSIYRQAAAGAGERAGLLAAIEQVSGGQGVDLDAITTATRDGVTEALGSLDADVTLNIDTSEV